MLSTVPAGFIVALAAITAGNDEVFYLGVSWEWWRSDRFTVVPYLNIVHKIRRMGMSFHPPITELLCGGSLQPFLSFFIRHFVLRRIKTTFTVYIMCYPCAFTVYGHGLQPSLFLGGGKCSNFIFCGNKYAVVVRVEAIEAPVIFITYFTVQ